MAAVKNSKPTKTDSRIVESLEWWGFQYICRDRSTGHIYNRSFPWWGPNIAFAIDHAAKVNKEIKDKSERWTHLLIHTHFTEHAQTREYHEVTEREIAL